MTAQYLFFCGFGVNYGMFIVVALQCVFKYKGGDRLKKRMLTFLLGASCFIVSQPLLRMPILNYVQGNTKFVLFYILNPLLAGMIIAFSAGIFEEGFRFIFKRFLLKPPKTEMLEPILFGFGHGLAEALMILIPALSIVPIGDLKIAFLERILAIILHIGLSVIVWNGFQLNKKLKYLGIAILIHGLTNSLIPIFGSAKNAIIILESLFLLIDVCMIVYVYHSRKIYDLEEEKI